jgi:tetratricopeptide (TPR) repeat protein
MTSLHRLALSCAFAAALSAGCTKTDVAALPPPEGEPIFTPAAVEHYRVGLAEMARLDAESGWDDEKCEAVAQHFLASAREQGAFFAGAFYNAGAAYHRCGNVGEARKHYSTVLEKDPKAHRARLQLARLAALESQETKLDGPITEIERAAQDSDFQNVEALVELARLQMKRGGIAATSDGADDFERAKKNLQRALAVDDAFMPAQNQLALYYLERAKREAGKKRTALARGPDSRKADTQALDLALLVATQAARKQPGHAPIHNTLGLVAVEQGDMTRAVRSFAEARKLDRSFFEAHMNYASVNLSFRGFGEAEAAYRAAMALRPKDYDAHVGLALALRGQVEKAPAGSPKLTESEALLEKAKKLEPARPEAYFNHAVLVQGFRAQDARTAKAELTRAIELYGSFVERAKGNPELAAAVEDVVAVPKLSDDACIRPPARGTKDCKRGRIFDLREIISFHDLDEKQQASKREAAETNAAVLEATTPPR